MSKTQKEIEQELNEISDHLDNAESDIESWIDNIHEVAIDLGDTKGLIGRCHDSIRVLIDEIEADGIKAEEIEAEEIKVLKLHNWTDFLALQDGMLTQIYLLRSVADNLKIGQEIEISSGILGESETTLKRKVTKIHNAPFLNTSGATTSIVHFEKIGE